MEDESSSRSTAKPLEPEVDQAQTTSEKPSERIVGRTTAELTVQTFEFSGPLPPPQILQGYNQAFAGCAERIVAMAERQSAHRQAIERSVIDANCDAQTRGQYFAFVLAAMVVGGGIYLLAQGKSLEGFSAIILAVASLIGALVFSRTEQKKERQEKLRPLPSAPPKRDEKPKKKKKR